MSLAHLVYIPFVIVLGVAAGWHLGSTTVRAEWDRAEKRRKDREEGKAP
jgi:hypothetical protein